MKIAGLNFFTKNKQLFLRKKIILRRETEVPHQQMNNNFLLLQLDDPLL